ncbi:MAG: TIGR00366 family protein, partial [Edaphobacter sp.]
MSVTIHPIKKQSLLGRATAFFVYLFEKVMPDPFVFAVILTFVGALLALKFAPNATLPSVASAWYGGIFTIFAFAFQMVLMLVAGYALAIAPPVQRGLARVAAMVSTPLAAISLTVVISMITSWINWGLGLVTAALLAREIAKRVELDFGWLVAAAYTGFVISTEGLSGSIALSQATHGSALNIVEKVMGHGLPLSQTVFTRFNLVPCLVLLIVLPIIFRALQPSERNTIVADPDRLRQEDQQVHTKEGQNTFGSMLDNAWIINLSLVAFGFFALISEWCRTGFALDLNSVIMMLV